MNQIEQNTGYIIPDAVKSGILPGFPGRHFAGWVEETTVSISRSYD
jgi:hypothetical protein